jgi:hypothetical protein
MNLKILYLSIGKWSGSGLDFDWCRLQHIPGVNFVNVLRVPFSYESLFSSYVLALNELSYKKRTRKMLMKLTPGSYKPSVVQRSDNLYLT